MPQAIGIIIAWVAGAFVRSLLTGLGIAFGSFFFIKRLVDEAISRILNGFDNFAVDVLQILEISGVSTGLSIMLSAIVVRAFIVSVRRVMLSGAALTGIL